MPLNLYYNPLSAPSRTVLAFMHLTDVKHEKKLVDLLKGEQKTPEYAEINPLQTVPAITDGTNNLGESEAIVKYLMSTRKVGNMYYPTDIKDRDIVDKYLAFHHSTMRPNLDQLFLAQLAFLFPEAGKKEEAKPAAEATCKTFDEVFLQGKKYIAGDILTIADLFAVNELTNIYYTVPDFDWEQFPAVREYIERCLGNPVLREINKPAKEFGELMKQKQIQ